MFVLWGIRREYRQQEQNGSSETVEHRDLLTTFAEEHEAYAYVKNSTIKDGPSALSSNVQQGHYRFHKDSLLRQYDSYDITSTTAPTLLEEKDKLYDALAAWRDLIWHRIWLRKYPNDVVKWSNVLNRHLNATKN